MTINDPVPKKKIHFDFIKGNNFRVIHADGFFGGPTGHAVLAMTVYNERMAIPQQITHEIMEDGSLGDEIKEERVAREAVVREAEACILMNLKTAEALRQWLDKQISQLQTLTKTAEKKEGV